MALTAGERLGPYEILAPIGAGGMGEVYRARDPRLNRDVAIKVSQERFSDRFEREARAVAALNHPNICTLYDVGPNYLVMELIDGESPKGPMALEEALRIARQIADALEAAHEKGIVHRDLKPGNIKVRPDGTVKVLDFGLAKSVETASGDPASSPTLTISLTRVGMILGTAAYMSPEQARGKTVDKRADIWAFGVVLYELLTGERLFAGETVSDTLIEVATKEPDWNRVPAKVRRLLRRCLEKDPKRRLRDIGEAWFVLEDAPEETAPSRGALWARLGMVATLAAAVFAIVAGALAFIHFREKPPAVEPMRFQIPAPEKHTITGLALSPDGRWIVFVAHPENGVDQLWIRALDTLQARPLAGTEGATRPFWSPDSRFVAFGAQGKLKKVEASGGPPQTLCDLPSLRFFSGGAWSRDGVYIATGQGLMRCEAAGAASPGTARGASLLSPSFLPDGRHFVYLEYSQVAGKSGIDLGSLDAKSEQQGSNRLVDTDSGPNIGAVYAPSQAPDPSNSSTGYVLFVRGGSLLAQPLDAQRLKLAGEAVRIADDLGEAGKVSASTTGVLAYLSGATIGTHLTWVGRDGNPAGTPPDIPGYTGFWNLSPDGTRLAGVVNRTEIWLYDFTRGNSTKFTSDSNVNSSPVWSKDGSHIIFSSRGDGVSNLIRKDSNGAGNEEVLLKSSEGMLPYDLSRDGRFLLYGVITGHRDSLWVLSLSESKPMQYLKRDALLHQARFSPDGNCVAYASDESGKQEVYVQPFPLPSGNRWHVSKGGSQPRWRSDGKELFYTSADSKMMAVDAATAAGKCGPGSQPGIPQALFTTPSYNGIRTHRYDTPDGRKFLIPDAPEEGRAAASPITIVLNWTAGLKK